MPVIETSTPLRAQSWRGLNLNQAPERIPSSDFVIGDNLWIIAGDLWTRPSRRGMFAQALPNPIYYLRAYAAADSSTPPNITTWLMFCSGGKLWIAQAGHSDPPTEVKIGGPGGTSFNLNSPSFRQERVGGYMYIVDGVGPLYKVKIPYVNGSTAYTAAAYVGLNAPTGAFTVALTNQVIDTTTDATKWSSFPALSWPGTGTVTGTGTVGATTAETINSTGQQFSGGTASPSPHPQGWLDGGDSVGYQAPPAGVAGVEIYGDAGAGPSWVDYDYPTPTYPANANTINNARVWVAAASAHSGGGGAFGLQAFPENANENSSGSTLINYTDLVIVTSGATSTISSAAHPFQTTDANKTIIIFGGTNFTPGPYTITAVNGGTHVATVNGNIGTATATGGIGCIGLDSGGAAGNNNNTLQVPPSAIAGADQASIAFKATGANVQYQQIFSFSSLGRDFDHLKLRIITPASQPGAVGVNTPSLRAVDVRLLIETSSSGVIHLKANNPIGVGFNCLGGVWVRRDYTGSPGGYVDYSTSNTISVRYAAPTSSGQIPFRIGFQKAGQTIAQIAWSNVVTYTSDGSAFYCDCSTIDSTIRAQTAYLYIKIDTDLAASINPADLCTIGPISTSGNLTLHEIYGGWGGDYTYQFTKVNATNDSTYFIDVVESDPSPMSTPPAQPNGVSNQTTFTLPVDPADGTTHWAVYRFGGVYTNEPARLIARVPIARDRPFSTGALINSYTDLVIVSVTGTTSVLSSVARAFIDSDTGAILNITAGVGFTQDSYIVNSVSGGQATILAAVGTAGSVGGTAALNSTPSSTSWNHTTRVFVDNTTDSSLEVNIPTFLLSGRTPLPNGATSITEWQNHMCAAIGSTSAISWELIGNSGLYFNTVNVGDPNDVAQSIKGAQFDTGGQDNDPIQTQVPLGAYLMIMKQRSMQLVTGQDAASFGINAQYIRNGYGLAAPNALAVRGSNPNWLGPDAFYEYNGQDDPTVMSDDIEPLLNPESRGLPPLKPSAYSQAFAIWKSRRMYLCVPGSSTDTTNSVMFVWDSRVGDNGGWVRWTSTSDNRVFNWTSACTLDQSDDLDDIFFGGMDGQIYSLAQSGGDTFLAGDTPLPIPIHFMSRAEGQTTTSTFGSEIMSPNYFDMKIPSWLQVNILTTENVALNFKITAAACDKFWSTTYQTNARQLCMRKPVDSQVTGVNCTVELTASSLTPILIKRLALELEIGSPGEGQ